MIDWLVALVAFSALGIAVTASWRGRSLRESLQDAQRRLYLAQARLNELESTVQKEVQSLKAVRRQQVGTSAFDPSMRLAEAIAVDPRVRQVLAQFHLGGCSSCAINEEHTIAQAALTYGVDLGQLMAALDALSNGQPTIERRPTQGGLLQLNEF